MVENTVESHSHMPVAIYRESDCQMKTRVIQRLGRREAELVLAVHVGHAGFEWDRYQEICIPSPGSR